MFQTVEQIATRPSYWIIQGGEGTISRGPSDKALLLEASRRAFGMVNTTFRAITVGTQIAPVRKASFWVNLRKALENLGEFESGVFEYDTTTHQLRRIGDWVGPMSVASGVQWYHSLDWSTRKGSADGTGNS